MGISSRQNIGIEKMPKTIQAAGIAAILLILEPPNHLVPFIIIIERENTSDANGRKKIILNMLKRLI
jgi:hypothetical protein